MVKKVGHDYSKYRGFWYATLATVGSAPVVGKFYKGLSIIYLTCCEALPGLNSGENDDEGKKHRKHVESSGYVHCSSVK